MQLIELHQSLQLCTAPSMEADAQPSSSDNNSNAVSDVAAPLAMPSAQLQVAQQEYSNISAVLNVVLSGGPGTCCSLADSRLINSQSKASHHPSSELVSEPASSTSTSTQFLNLSVSLGATQSKGPKQLKHAPYRPSLLSPHAPRHGKRPQLPPKMWEVKHEPSLRKYLLKKRARQRRPEILEKIRRETRSRAPSPSAELRTHGRLLKTPPSSPPRSAHPAVPLAIKLEGSIYPNSLNEEQTPVSVFITLTPVADDLPSLKRSRSPDSEREHEQQRTRKLARQLAELALRSATRHVIPTEDGPATVPQSCEPTPTPSQATTRASTPTPPPRTPSTGTNTTRRRRSFRFTTPRPPPPSPASNASLSPVPVFTPTTPTDAHSDANALSVRPAEGPSRAPTPTPTVTALDVASSFARGTVTRARSPLSIIAESKPEPTTSTSIPTSISTPTPFASTRADQDEDVDAAKCAPTLAVVPYIALQPQAFGSIDVKQEADADDEAVIPRASEHAVYSTLLALPEEEQEAPVASLSCAEYTPSRCATPMPTGTVVFVHPFIEEGRAAEEDKGMETEVAMSVDSDVAAAPEVQDQPGSLRVVFSAPTPPPVAVLEDEISAEEDEGLDDAMDVDVASPDATVSHPDRRAAVVGESDNDSGYESSDIDELDDEPMSRANSPVPAYRTSANARKRKPPPLPATRRSKRARLASPPADDAVDTFVSTEAAPPSEAAPVEKPVSTGSAEVMAIVPQLDAIALSDEAPASVRESTPPEGVVDIEPPEVVDAVELDTTAPVSGTAEPVNATVSRSTVTPIDTSNIDVPVEETSPSPVSPTSARKLASLFIPPKKRDTPRRISNTSSTVPPVLQNTVPADDFPVPDERRRRKGDPPATRRADKSSTAVVPVRPAAAASASTIPPPAPPAPKPVAKAKAPSYHQRSKAFKQTINTSSKHAHLQKEDIKRPPADSTFDARPPPEAVQRVTGEPTHEYESLARKVAEEWQRQLAKFCKSLRSFMNKAEVQKGPSNILDETRQTMDEMEQSQNSIDVSVVLDVEVVRQLSEFGNLYNTTSWEYAIKDQIFVAGAKDLLRRGLEVARVFERRAKV